MRNEVGYMEDDPPECAKQNRLSHRMALVLWVLASGIGWIAVMTTLIFVF